MFNPENKENEFFLRLGYSFDPSTLKRGDVLISEPFLADPNFHRSVVLLADYHKDEGAFGFILNKATEVDMNTVVESFDQVGYTFHYGGPVNPETLFFIHNAGEIITESKEIIPGLYWSGSYDEVKTQINMGRLQPTDVKFFGGYSGWSAGQLEDEIKERSWIITQISAHDALRADEDSMWKESLKHLGRQFSIMADFPENPELN